MNEIFALPYRLLIGALQCRLVESEYLWVIANVFGMYDAPVGEEKVVLRVILVFTAVYLAFIVFWTILSRFSRGKPGANSRGIIFIIIQVFFVVFFFGFLEAALVRYEARFPKTYRYDPVVFWRLVPNKGKTNSEGFRSEDVPAVKAPGEYRILALGDSSIYGDSISDSSLVFTAVLSDMLRNADSRSIRVINAGVSGYSSYQGLYLYRDIEDRYKPDMILLGYFNSDSHDDVIEDKLRNPNPEWIKRIQRRVSRLETYQFIRSGMMTHFGKKGDEGAPPGGTPGKVGPRVSPEDYRKNIENFVENARRKGRALILLNMPPNLKLGHYPQYRAIVYETAKEYGVPMADFYDEWLKKGYASPEYYADDIHPNEKGHRKMAEALYDLMGRRASFPV